MKRVVAQVRVVEDGEHIADGSTILCPFQRALWGKLEVADNGCWEWTAGLDAKGYGAAHLGGKGYKAHRLAWLLVFGVIPDRMQVMHMCDNPPCCNPSHLRLGSALDNNRDKERKGRGAHPSSLKTHCKNGHPFSGQNLRLRADGARRCATCYCENSQRRRALIKAVAPVPAPEVKVCTRCGSEWLHTPGQPGAQPKRCEACRRQRAAR